MNLSLLIASIVFVSLIYNDFIVIEDINTLALVFIAMYAVNSVLFLYRYRRYNIVCFETFFLFAFFLATFQYPLLANEFDYYTINRLFSISNQSYIDSMCVALFGCLFFLFGAILLGKSERPKKLTYDFSHINIYKLNNLFQYSTFAMFLAVMYMGGYKILSQYSVESSDRWGGAGALWDILWILFIISSVLQFIKMSNVGIRSASKIIPKFDKIYLINALLNTSLLLVAGYRSEFLFLISPLFLLYSSLVRRINTRQLLVVAIVGYLVLLIVGATRDFAGGVLNTENITRIESIFDNTTDVVRDFTPANGALYHLVDYADKNGITWGSNILLQVLAVVPFLQSLSLSLFEFVPGVSSSILFTLNLNYKNWSSGLGTHIIGDLYYTFGLVGVILFMSILGIAVSYLYNAIYIKRTSSIYIWTALCIMFANSLYSVRVEYFFILRTLGLSMLTIFLFSLIHQRKKT